MLDVTSGKSNSCRISIFKRANRVQGVPTRRLFIRGAASGIGAFALFGGAPRSAEPQLVWKASEWKLSDFQKLVEESARIKQVFDVVQIAHGAALNSIKNS